MPIDPNELSSDYKIMAPYWRMVDDILGGAETIRRAGERYLPKFESEKQAAYDMRRAVSPWTPIFADALRNLASKPFGKEVRALEIEGTLYEPLVENIDGEGNHLTVFAREMFRAGLGYGVDWVFVDYPRMAPGATLADERASGARPIWQRVPAQRLLAMYEDRTPEGMAPVLARIDESTIGIDEDGDELAVERVRVLWRPRLEAGGYGPAMWRLYERASRLPGHPAIEAPAALPVNRVSQGGRWELVDEGPITIGVIPLVPFVPSDRIDGTWRLRPLLRDLAYMQITEYQMESNLHHVQMMTCFPMLAAEGVRADDMQGLEIGPRRVLVTEPGDGGQAGTYRWLEPTGSSVTVLRDDLERFRGVMRETAMQPLTPQSGNLTATATAVAEAKAHSAVQAAAWLLKDALEQAFVFTAMWLGQSPDDAPSVDVHTDFGVEQNSVESMRVVLDMNTASLVSREATISEAKRRGILAPEYDPDDDLDAMNAEMEDDDTGIAVVPPLPPQPGQEEPAEQSEMDDDE